MTLPSVPKKTPANPKARLATLPELRPGLLAAYLAPVPPDKTLRAWFDRAGVPRFKANPGAARGGGHVYYHVAAIEKLLRSRAGLTGSADSEVGGTA